MLGLSELGQHLKEVREQKQISLDDLQRTTKIQKRYLIAIEEGRFDTLPGLFYARAFVKTYAETIGLDPDPLFEQYRNELPNPQREAVTLPSRAERTKSAVAPKSRAKRSSILPAMMAIVFLFVIVVAIWLMLQWGGGTNDEPVSPDETANVEDVDFSGEVGSSLRKRKRAEVEPEPEAQNRSQNLK